MISEKRQSLILQELKKKDFLSLQELIERTGCSASTIRRDLSKLNNLDVFNAFMVVQHLIVIETKNLFYLKNCLQI